MDKQQFYSHGLLYSVEPQDLSSLHLQDENVKAEFDWSEEKNYLLGQKILDYFKANTAKIIRSH